MNNTISTNTQTNTFRPFNNGLTSASDGMGFSDCRTMDLTKKRSHFVQTLGNYDVVATLHRLEQRRIETVTINANRPSTDITGIHQLWQDINLFRCEQHGVKLKLEALEYRLDDTNPLARLCNYFDNAFTGLNNELIDIKNKGESEEFDEATIENNQLLCLLETLETVPLLPNETLLKSLNIKDILAIGITDISNAIQDNAKEAANRFRHEQRCIKMDRMQQDSKRRFMDRQDCNQKDSIKHDAKHSLMEEVKPLRDCK
ncbi:MAG: hypothetical protein KAG53_09095 [Endozoicomonadaceae bacterium]|nr:hypothetical protein [Endozoicomonadaceae bacterium]